MSSDRYSLTILPLICPTWHFANAIVSIVLAYCASAEIYIPVHCWFYFSSPPNRHRENLNLSRREEACWWKPERPQTAHNYLHKSGRNQRGLWQLPLPNCSLLQKIRHTPFKQLSFYDMHVNASSYPICSLHAKCGNVGHSLCLYRLIVSVGPQATVFRLSSREPSAGQG